MELKSSIQLSKGLDGITRLGLTQSLNSVQEDQKFQNWLGNTLHHLEFCSGLAVQEQASNFWTETAKFALFVEGDSDSGK